MRHALLLVVLPLACAVSLASRAAAQPPAGDSISLESFVAELSRLSAEVGAAESAEAAAPIATTVPQRWRVNVEGQHIDVDARWLSAALADAARTKGRWHTARAVIRGRLARLKELAGASVQETGSRPQARTALATILHREEFQRSAASRWRERLQQRVGEWLEKLWARLGGGSGAGRTAAIALAWIAALGALVGLVFFLARSLAERPRHAALSLGGRGPLRPRARALALRALEAARAGNGREAVRLGYRSALTRFEENGAWRVDDARTPREYLPLLRANDSHRPLLVDLTRRFEHIWYGNRPVQPDDASRVTAHLEELGCLRPGERAT